MGQWESPAPGIPAYCRYPRPAHGQRCRHTRTHTHPASDTDARNRLVTDGEPGPSLSRAAHLVRRPYQDPSRRSGRVRFLFLSKNGPIRACTNGYHKDSVVSIRRMTPTAPRPITGFFLSLLWQKHARLTIVLLFHDLLTTTTTRITSLNDCT